MSVKIQRRNTLVMLAAGILGISWLSLRDASTRRFGVPELELAEAKALIDAGAVVIDVRSKDAFDYRHMPPAVLIPLAILRAGIPSSLAEAKEQQIVVYCNDGHSSGPEAAHILRQHGFSKVGNMKSGIEGWAAAGLPLVKAS